MKKTNIGGQALIEGVMMRGDAAIALAVRDESGQIRIDSSRFAQKNRWWKKIPVLRGVVAFFDSMINGTRTLTKSGEVFVEENEGKKATDKQEKGWGLMMFFTILISLVLSIGLFFFLPNVVTQFVTDVFSWQLSPFLKNLIDGILRLAIFLIYMFAVSKLKDIKRVFMYHGAEHKTINCFEHEMELTVENVRKCSRIHDRCGTSFMFLVFFVSVVVFSFVGWSDNTWLRLLSRLALLPVVAGLSYEVLKLLAKSDSPVLKPIKAPGAWLQKLTTKEPDDSMIEVAIASFNAVLTLQNDPEAKETKFPKTMPLKEFRQKAVELFEANGLADDFADIDWILCEVTLLKRNELKDEINVTPYMQIKAEKMFKRRLEGEPLQYIIGNTEFFGYKFFVNRDVLIPRFETELLVDKLIKYVSADKKVLDLCCGSGAIGITLKLKTNCDVTLSDVSGGALKVTAKNAKNLKAEVKTVLSDLFENVEGKFDVIVSNPPYIPTADILTLDDNVKNYEPSLALDGGEDGLDFYRKILSQAGEHLNEKGVVAFEIGIGQADDIIAIADDFCLLEKIADYNGIDRILIFEKRS